MTEWKPVVIIGAPRSGTNMLRDALTRLAGVESWPCDEINYIWRHGNLRWPNDEIPRERATPSVRRYVRGAFAKMATRSEARVIVEKTCANSLRVPFVNAILPEATFVFIVRDGIDAVPSAMQRWKAPLDLDYVGKKAAFVPKTDLPWYAARYLWNRIYKVSSGSGRLASWGPVYAGMPEDVEALPLEEVCARQWKRCVELSAHALERLGPERVVAVRYEDFVVDPVAGLTRIAEGLHIQAAAPAIEAAAAPVSSRSVGKGERVIDAAAEARIRSVIGAGRVSLAPWGGTD